MSYHVAQMMLESKYSQQGLKFSTRFEISDPVQAFGFINGERFYFRERRNRAELRVGPVVNTVENIVASRKTDRIHANVLQAEQDYSDGKIDEKRLALLKSVMVAHSPQNGFEECFFPHVVTRHVVLNDVYLRGLESLTQVFSDLLELLFITEKKVVSFSDVISDNEVRIVFEKWLKER